MAKLKVLFILHNHPALSPGGTEAYTLRVFDAMRESDELEPLLLARAPAGAVGPHGDNPFAAVTGEPGQYLLGTDEEAYDKFFMTAHDRSIYTEHLAGFLRTHRPDIVHIQHTLFLGVPVIATVRQVLGNVPIVHTLHEYLPICNHYGQLVRTHGRELCLEASPRRCHECYPDIAPQQFFLRQRYIQSHFAHVDLFVAPSEFLLERYVAWGIPRERIVHEDHGFFPVTPRHRPEERPRNRFAFFGVLTPFKGIDVLLNAMLLLGPEWDGHLWIHGASYEAQQEEVQREIERLLAATAATVTFLGPYEHERLPELMAGVDWVVVPSIWWENAPLVIQEAFLHGRPVICSNIGGMAEKVADRVSGLHFTNGDAGSLSRIMAEAAGTPGLWDQLRAGIPAVRGIDEHVARLHEIYRDLIAARRQPTHAEQAAP
jgi:glycosyltransferase involved in cell wall biosynthesis